MADGILKVGQIQTSSGSGTITIGQSGETISIPSGATVSGAGANIPAFQATLSGDQDIADNTTAKVTFDTETFDSDGTFASNKFTASIAGKYLIVVKLTYYDASGNLNDTSMSLYKNGSEFETSIKKRGGEDVERDIIAVSTILNLAVNDYIEVYAYGNTDNSGAYTILAGTNQSHFSTCRIIGA